MSIINDALKKAERKKKFSFKKPFQILSEIDQIKTETERFIIRRWLIWAGTGVVCLFGIALVTNSFRKPATPATIEQKLTPQKMKLTQRSQDRAPTIFSKKTVSRFPSAQSQFNLSGILYDDLKPMAIVNERVVTKGALINGAKILEIQPNFVRLFFEEEDITLNLK